MQGSMESLDEAIQKARDNVGGDEDEAEAAKLLILGDKLESRYGLFGDAKDLEEAMQVTRKAIEISSDDSPYLSSRLNSLGNQLHRRYEHSLEIEDLKEAVDVAQQAIDVALEDDPDLAIWICSLASHQGALYKCSGDVTELLEAIKSATEAVEISSDDDPNYAQYLNCLGMQVTRLFEHDRKKETLEKAIKVAQHSVNLTPKGRPDLVLNLNNLGYKLGLLYEHTGNIRHIEEAIKVMRESVDVAPTDSMVLVTCLGNLGHQLHRRYERTQRWEDLEEGIGILGRAISLIPSDHADLAFHLNILGNQLESRYERRNELEDCTEAVQVARRVVDATPQTDRSLPQRLTNLGNKLIVQYEYTEKPEDLEEAIQVSRKAIKVASEDCTDLVACLNSLGIQLRYQYERTKQSEYIEEAVQVTRQAINMTPEDHPNLTDCLNNLARALLPLDGHNKTEVIEVLLRAKNNSHAVPFSRIAAYDLLITLFLELKDYDKAYEMCKESMELIPRVSNRSLSRQDQQHVASIFSGLAAKACSLALQLAQPPQEALQLLERGRGIILSQLFDDRSDIALLKAADLELRIKYDSLRLEVDAPIEHLEDPFIRDVAIERRRKAVDDLNQCVLDMERIPEFRQAQQGPTEKQMQECAAEGCIILVNITALRSDAIVVFSGGFRAISLPDLYPGDVPVGPWVDNSRDMESETHSSYSSNRLSWLWIKCVKPVLDELEMSRILPAGPLSRVWWIGTGNAHSFPFHSAGDFSSTSENTLSRVISSYTPTIKALAYSMSSAKKHIQDTKETKPSVLMATMPTTPGQKALPGVIREKRAVEECCRGVYTFKALEEETAGRILREIPVSDILHCACHGSCDPHKPLESHLLFQKTGPSGPVLDRLTVSSILNMTTLGRAWIAYISACSAAEVKAQELADEGLHIVSAFQVAGFAHVIGSLWSVDDDVCVDLAEVFYERLISSDDQRSISSVAAAFHAAVLHIRSKYAYDPLKWAAYIHSGA
jgi:tetratricopeptide (TPR) repeat protein